MKATPILLTLSAAAMCAGGCSKWYTTNSDAAIARAWAPSEFFPPSPDTPHHSEIEPGPSTTSLDRSDWAVTSIVARNAQPEHQPIYTRSVFIDDGIPRNQGKYPTASSALDSITTESQNAQVAEALIAPFAAAGDIILFPVRLFRTGMWKTVDNGLEPYERLPGSAFMRNARAGFLANPQPTTEVEQ